MGNAQQATRDLLITYNLDGGDEQYAQLGELIKSLGACWHKRETFDSVWFVKTERTVGEARDILFPALTEKDHLFVAEVSDWASSRAKKVSDWLNGQSA